MGKQSKEEINGSTQTKEMVSDPDHFQIQIPKSYKAMFFLGVFFGTFLLRHQVTVIFYFDIEIMLKVCIFVL